MVHGVIKWCSQESYPEFYIPRSALFPNIRFVSLVLNLLKQFFFLRKNNVLLKNAISFLVVQSHAEATQSYAPVNMKGFFCPPSFSNQMASAQMASYHRASHGKHSPMELFFNKYTTLVLINFIKLLISFQIQCY